MIEKKIYTCEICNSSYIDEKMAVECEKSGVPSIIDKYLNKWIILPLNVLFTVNEEESSNVSNKIIYRLFRVEANRIISSDVNFVGHKVKFSGRSFEDSSMLIPGSYLYITEVDVSETEQLNQELVKQEKFRNIYDFEQFSKLQHENAERLLQEIKVKYSLEFKNLETESTEYVAEIKK